MLVYWRLTCKKGETNQKYPETSDYHLETVFRNVWPVQTSGTFRQASILEPWTILDPAAAAGYFTELLWVDVPVEVWLVEGWADITKINQGYDIVVGWWLFNGDLHHYIESA